MMKIIIACLLIALLLTIATPVSAATPKGTCSFYVKGKSVKVIVTGHAFLYHNGRYIRTLSDGVWVAGPLVKGETAYNWRCQ